ncbi:MAG TPA: DUF4245 domain-containing protein [Aeromicrobium sp.]|nr:DUF4245 domain-containing protein [Aeromicrobium sp.]
MASSRGNPDLGDIVRSVAVLGILVLALYGVGQLLTSEPENVTRPVDWAPVATDAREMADYQVLAPDELPEGWVATSARFDPSTQRWRLFILGPDDRFIGLEQSSESEQTLLDSVAEDSEPLGSAKVLDRVWSVHVGPAERITYLTSSEDITTMVTGTVDQGELETYIDSLR